MNKKIFLYALAVAIFSFTACKNNQSSKSENADNQTTDLHNVQNTLDWEGTYFGVLPCASCPGINTLITLIDDGTFEKTTEYLESDDTPETTNGKFDWKGDSIIIIGESAYLVGENQLFALDVYNQVVEGELAEHYILNKVNLEPEPDVNDGYSLMEYKGSDGKEYDIIYNVNPEKPVALIDMDGTQLMLTQTESWAKGAVYSTKNAKLTAEGDNATLELNGKKIELKERK